MKRVLSLFAVCAACVGGSASAATVIVNVGGSAGLVFTPQTVTVDVGDTVTFVNKGGVHNAVADDGSFRCARGCDGDGRNGNGNASNSNWIASVTMNKPGTVGYFCEVHGMPGTGMFGTIVVQGAPPPPPPPPEAVPLDSRWLLALIGAIALAARLASRNERES